MGDRGRTRPVTVLLARAQTPRTQDLSNRNSKTRKAERYQSILHCCVLKYVDTR